MPNSLYGAGQAGKHFVAAVQGDVAAQLHGGDVQGLAQVRQVPAHSVLIDRPAVQPARGVVVVAPGVHAASLFAFGFGVSPQLLPRDAIHSSTSLSR